MKQLLEHYEQDKYLFYREGVEVIPPSVILMDEIAGVDLCKKLEQIIRVAYKSEDKTTDDSYIKMLNLIKTNKHLSTFEHVSITWKAITNRGVTHELVRHRIASFTQESTRYVNYNKKPAQIIYPAWLFEKTIDQKNSWYRFVYEAMANYKELINMGFKPQEARGVLPNDVKTEIYVTMNLRELLHFFELRTSPQAHPDIRVIANELQHQLREKVPIIFG